MGSPPSDRHRLEHLRQHLRIVAERIEPADEVEVIGPGTVRERLAAIIAAEAKGYLQKENIRIQINTVTDSPTLLRSLISGKYHLIINNADNVIAWAEGQGEDPQKNDFIIFLGGNRGVNQKLIGARY
jgi:ABC-type nitrate/sulfonate/bicarbonate transport system substrate-binding protein